MAVAAKLKALPRTSLFIPVNTSGERSLSLHVCEGAASREAPAPRVQWVIVPLRVSDEAHAVSKVLDGGRPEREVPGVLPGLPAAPQRVVQTPALRRPLHKRTGAAGRPTFTSAPSSPSTKTSA